LVGLPLCQHLLSSTSYLKSQNLWDACTEGNHALVELILGRFQDANVNWVGPENGDTPLHRACRLGHLQVVEILLRHSQVNVNAGNDKLATPLLVACQEGHVEVVKLLLADLRVDVNLPQNGGYTPFFMACQSGYKEVVSLLLGTQESMLRSQRMVDRLLFLPLVIRA